MCPSSSLDNGPATASSSKGFSQTFPLPFHEVSPSGSGGKSDEGAVPLAQNFVPTPWTVLVGRDKRSAEAPGTKRLHIIIGWYLARYTKSHEDKEEKSRIISEIEWTIRSACAERGVEIGAFVKYSNGRWWEVGDTVVREKIARMLREALHTKYSSSSKQKRARRRLQTKSSLKTKSLPQGVTAS